MEKLFTALLVVHILGGSLALITGYAAMWVKRGGPRHRQLGRWYVRGMAAVLLSGFPMSILHPNPFLFGIVFFSAYFVLAGRGAAVNRNNMPTRQDRAIAAVLILGAVTSIALIGWVHFSGGEMKPAYKITGLVFAALGLGRGVGDFLEFQRGPITGKARIRRHLINMCVGLIATTTAVAVTMIGYLPAIPPIVAWLGPTLVVTPLIIMWSRQIETGTYKY